MNSLTLLAQAAAFADSADGPSTTIRIMTALPWFAWIPIVAIVGGGVNTALGSWIKHRERMALIRQGIHPDAVPQVDPHAKPAYPEHAEL